MKICRDCGNTKPLSEFHRAKVNKDGYNNQCRSCRSDTAKRYRKDNPDYNANMTKEAKETKRGYDRQYKKDNEERRRETSRIWEQNNREPRKEYLRQWRLKNPDSKTEYDNKRRAIKANSIGQHTASDIHKLRSCHFCIYCGMSIEHGEIDHIMPLGKQGSNSVENLALACTPCNRSKGSKSPSLWIKQQKLHRLSLTIRYRIQHNLSGKALTPFDTI